MSELRVVAGIPTMNNERTIWATLSGLAKQTRPPDCVHIVDASDDWTPRVIRIFQQQTNPPFQLKLERQTNRGGVGAARARIYQQFDGDILACFDTDAVPAKDWLEKHLQTHEEHPSTDVVSGVNNDRQPGLVESPHDRSFLVQKNCTIKSRALDAVDGWDQQFDRGEDWDIAIRLWQSGAKAYTRNDLVRRPIEGEGIGNRLLLRLKRPSSVRFLRKYGLWYARFHPTHVLGDVMSVLSVAAGILTIPLVSVFGVRALFLLIIPLLGMLGYIAVQSRTRTGGHFDIRFVSRRAPEFFLLGYTAMREFLSGPKRGWNYAGLN